MRKFFNLFLAQQSSQTYIHHFPSSCWLPLIFLHYENQWAGSWNIIKSEEMYFLPKFHNCWEAMQRRSIKLHYLNSNGLFFLKMLLQDLIDFYCKGKRKETVAAWKSGKNILHTIIIKNPDILQICFFTAETLKKTKTLVWSFKLVQDNCLLSKPSEAECRDWL